MRREEMKMSQEELINIEFGENIGKAVTIIIDKTLLQTVINAWINKLLTQITTSTISGAISNQ